MTQIRMWRGQRARIILVIAVSCLATTLPAQETTYTRFLLPMYFEAPVSGAFGSLWTVESWVHYSGTEGAFIAPRPFCFGSVCPIGFTLSPGLAPLPLLVQMPFAEPAALFHVERQYASLVTFSSRVRDLSRQAESAGTSVPVISEGEMFEGTLRLLDVPVTSTFRATLRIYALPETADPEVEVRYLRMSTVDAPQSEAIVLRSERVSLRTTPGVIEGFHFYPSMAERGNLQDLAELSGEEAVWIEISPVSTGLRFWAFVSVTNNVTQEVTLAVP